MPPLNSELYRWFTEEVAPHEEALRGWLCRRFPALRDVDDIVQETYARLLRAKETGSVVCPRAYLFVTARNLTLNHFRHLRHELVPGEETAEGLLDESIPIPENVAIEEDLQLLVQAIQTLPTRCRQIMTLRKIYGLPQREVAKRLGLSECTVESQGAIGLQKCIAFFRRHGYDLRAGRSPARR